MNDLRRDQPEGPSDALLENGLVISFSLRKGLAKINEFILCLLRFFSFFETFIRYDHRLGILTVFISRIYGLEMANTTTSYYIKSKAHQ